MLTDTAVKAQLPLTQAPEIGSQPANILKDISIGAYTKEGYPNRDNFQAVYNKPVSIGQCTWYAACRFHETTGIDIITAKTPNVLYGFGEKNWVEIAKNSVGSDIIGSHDKNAVQSQSIAIWDGHVVFVEYVEYSEEGKPSIIYFTEANYGHDDKTMLTGVYYPNFDCKVKKLSFDDFLNRSSKEFVGYVFAK